MTTAVSLPRHAVRNNVFRAIGVALLLIVIVSFGSAAIQVGSLKNTAAHLVLAACYVIALVLGLLIARHMKLSNSRIGFAAPHAAHGLPVLWFVPIVVIEAVGLLPGLTSLVGASTVLSLIVLTIVVGLGEELYFRGLILRVLQKIGVRTAIWGSAAIFALGHLPNALQYSGPYVLLQFIFAFVMGVAAACLVLRTGSLWPGILWHMCHDFIGYSTGNTVSGIAGAATIIQIILIALYVVLLMPKRRGENKNHSAQIR